MDHNVIAIIWDFDKTLIPGYMQEPIFNEYNIDSKQFWDEVNSLHQLYAEKGVRVNKDTIYLNHMITCTNQNIFQGLNNEKLREFGKELKFYPGIPKILQDLRDIVEKEKKYELFSIKVEHYIVSTGLTEMIRGSKVNSYVDGIWGCEFIEKPIRSNLDIKIKEEIDDNVLISQIGYMIDNTSKTRAIFEINKGSNKFEIDVNSKIDKDKRRVPFENMIYIADGPSDIPVFSILNQYGGKTFAIYPKGNTKAFNQVNNLIRDGRINMYAEADYQEGTTAYMWLTENVKQIAEKIYKSNLSQIIGSAGNVPRHIVE
ncbi:MAG: haloacid dehalogenase-like hydrolase [Eubacterium sp.]|nr:haloacid dehalogenase-like hydrolase [Eubacterium sp.]